MAGHRGDRSSDIVGPLIQHTKSVPTKLQSFDENEEKGKSLMDLSTSDRLSVSATEFRRRSRSEPLSLEASKIASELKRLSDTLNRTYLQGETALKRNRRHTFSGGKQQNRDSFHFDYENYKHREVNTKYSGTSV